MSEENEPTPSDAEADPAALKLAELPAHFARGGAGKPQPLPRGASGALVLISVFVLGSVVAMAMWLFL